MKTQKTIEWSMVPVWFSQYKLKQAEALVLKFMKNRIFSLKFAYSALPEQFTFFENEGLDALEAYDMQNKVNGLLFPI